ncbi:MAG: glycosyltransferase family 1 protein [Alphaproteobacteria bacterium]|nr:glycosyltransferase family 1 protein [Alphaproteobacteria bacterium]
MSPVIWIDVEDVQMHLTFRGRPTGIQRLAFEAARALVEMAGTERVRFLRHAAGDRGFYEVPFATLSDAYRAAVTEAARKDLAWQPAAVAAATEEAGPSAQAPGILRRIWRKLGGLLPGEVRMAVLDILLHQWAAVRAVPKLVRTVRKARWRADPTAPVVRVAEAAMAPGDVLFGIAAPWSEEHMSRAEAACRDRGVRYATLVYDMIPVVRPEFCVVSVTRRYRTWAERMLPLADVPMAISQATRIDMEMFAARDGIALRAPVRVVPVGTGFPSIPQASAEAGSSMVPDEPFILFVSTIEVRKNHQLLLRVWRRLLETMPPENVPLLVLAGGIGWLVGDLMQQLRNAAFLDGRVEVVDSPSDAQLALLYRDAMFTVYPSHYEGWGLPVVESHYFGTPVVCADNTSLPEAGGDLARYFDADSVGDAVRVIRGLLEDPAGLDAWRAEVRARFRPVEWRETAAAMLAAVDCVNEAVGTSAMDGPSAAG